jgi:YggT family protein
MPDAFRNPRRVCHMGVCGSGMDRNDLRRRKKYHLRFKRCAYYFFSRRYATRKVFLRICDQRGALSMHTMFWGIDAALEIYIWILLAAALLSLLISFNAVDSGRVARVDALLQTVTEPARRPFRNLLPDLGAVDITPIVAIVAIVFVRYLIALYIAPQML